MSNKTIGYDFFARPEIAALRISDAEAENLGAQHFGHPVIAESLGSQQDQNFMLTTDDGRRIGVLKIANPVFSEAEVQAQDDAAQLVQAAEPQLRLATALPGVDGLTYTPGVPFGPHGLAEALYLSGTALTTVGFGYVVVSMLGVAAVALFFSTLTTSSIGAALGTIGLLIASTVLLGLDAAGALHPFLPTRYWLAFVDLFRDPILWTDVGRGLVVQLGYLLVFTLAAWASFTTKDVDD